MHENNECKSLFYIELCVLQEAFLLKQKELILIFRGLHIKDRIKRVARKLPIIGEYAYKLLNIGKLYKAYTATFATTRIYIDFIINDFFTKQSLLYQDNPLDIHLLCSKSASITGSLNQGKLNKRFAYLPILFQNKPILSVNDKDWEGADFYFIWGLHPEIPKLKLLQSAMNLDKPVLLLEGGFITSITTWVDRKAAKEYKSNISFVVDDISHYYNRTRPSRLLTMLNSDRKLSDEEKTRAKNLIKTIVTQKLSKYNHQPIFNPQIGRQGRSKVLVIDQSYADYSIGKGGASDYVFNNMLQCAIEENPHSDIIIKTHPDIISNKSRTGYFVNIKDHDNIYTVRYPINPISLLQVVDKVYVCTSQFGIEALMCGKEVVTCGVPFYAGWGLTDDRNHLITGTRTRTRTLEELFYFAYVLYSHYVDPRSNSLCEIETSIDNILHNREEYFKKFKIRHDI